MQSKKSPLLVGLMIFILVASYFGLRGYVDSVYKSSSFREQISTLITQFFKAAGSIVTVEVGPIRSDGFACLVPTITIYAAHDREASMVLSDVRVTPDFVDLLFSDSYVITLAGKVAPAGSLAATIQLQSQIDPLLTGAALAIQSVVASAASIEIAAAQQIFLPPAKRPLVSLSRGLYNFNAKWAASKGTLSLSTKDVFLDVGAQRSAKDVQIFVQPAMLDLSPGLAQLTRPLTIVFPKGKVTLEGSVVGLGSKAAFDLQVSSRFPVVANLFARAMGCRGSIKKKRFTIKGPPEQPQCE